MKDKAPKTTLQAHWDKKLAKYGLLEEMEQQRVPIIPMEAIEALKKIDPDIEGYLEKLRILSSKFQNNILMDLKNKRESGVAPTEILERFKVLVTKSEELQKMTSEDSDKEHKPESPKEKKESEDIAREIVDRLLGKIEKIVEESRPKTNGKDEYIN